MRKQENKNNLVQYFVVEDSFYKSSQYLIIKDQSEFILQYKYQLEQEKVKLEKEKRRERFTVKNKGLRYSRQRKSPVLEMEELA